MILPLPTGLGCCGEAVAVVLVVAVAAVGCFVDVTLYSFEHKKKNVLLLVFSRVRKKSVDG